MEIRRGISSFKSTYIIESFQKTEKSPGSFFFWTFEEGNEIMKKFL